MKIVEKAIKREDSILNLSTHQKSETVRVEKLDEVFMRVHCDDGLAKDLHDFFSFTVPNAKFMPSYKNRYWDGKVRLFSIKTNKIYIGLLPYVDEFCRERGFNFEGINDVIGEKERQPDDLELYRRTELTFCT